MLATRMPSCGDTPRQPSIQEMALQLRARRMRVLVVEDNAAVLTLTCALLEKVAVEIYTASNGEEAVARFAALRPDLVLMDICMPGMNGQTAASLMRRYETFAPARVPIIAMTAAVVEDLHPGSLHPDFDFCLVKPFTRQRLYEVLLAWAPSPCIAGPAIKTEVVDVRANHLGSLSCCPAGRIQELADQIGLDTVGRIVAVFTGEMDEALASAQRAIALGDRASIRAKVHFMLGGAVNLGLHALVTACDEVLSAADDEVIGSREPMRDVATTWSEYRAILKDWQDH